MKKILSVIAVAVVSISAQASFLNWQVPASTGYNGAQLYAVSGTAKTEATGGTVIDAVSGLPATKSTDISGYGDSFTYYIELVNYTDSSNGVYDRGHAMSSKTFTYSELSGAISDGALSVAGMTAVWTGAAVQPTPEPTSGLLLLMGFAMLGLKRKKEV